MRDWLEAFPRLRDIDDRPVRQLLAAARRVTVGPGEVMFRDGDLPRGYLLVLEGRVRVRTLTDSGREVTLYRVEPGQSCVLTTSCLIARDPYPAEGISETEVQAVLFPADRFRAAVRESPAFRDFVFAAYGQRLSSLILLVREIASRRLDVRLASLLLRHAGTGGLVRATHQDLAAELGTAREVISRQLKEMERAGWLRLSRGTIEIARAEPLRRLSESGAA